MRSLRFSATVLVLVGVLRLTAMAEQDVTGPKKLLALRPKFLQNFEYDTPTDPAAVNGCKVENVVNDQNRNVGYTLRDGQGKLLRRFVVAHSSRIDQWSYYQDGFEVYREEDIDGDRSLDEARWLNVGGTRIAQIEKSRIKAWKQISAEEASKVLVQALVTRDDDLLETLMATPAELAAAGVPKEIVAKIAAAGIKRAEAIAALQTNLIGWNKYTVWNRFDGTFPHVIPADAALGLAKDLTLYENVMVIPGTLTSPQNNAKLAFLQVPDMIQLGATWKFLDVPRAIDPVKPIVSIVGGMRGALFDRGGDLQQRDEAVDAALKALADYDVKNAPLLQTGEKEKIAKYNMERVPLLRAVVKASKNLDEQLGYNKQVVDCLVAAYRTELFAQGKKTLDAVIASGGKLGSYAAYCMIDAEFALNNDKPNANILANQKQWMADLEEFLKKFPDADEVAPVLLHLANANEFNAEEKTARAQYTRLADGFAATEAGKKAVGALRRLDLVGQTLAIKGTGLQNETIDTARALGKPILIVFWASWASPVKADLPELIEVYNKYHGMGFEIFGVAVDNERAELDAFLREKRLPWPQIFEPGGMDSRLAIDYGIISLPTMFLVDAEGKVVSRNMRISDLDKQLDKLLPAKQAGIADRRD
jgi:thiol-disulfide isomerase/thioredoxin